MRHGSPSGPEVPRSPGQPRSPASLGTRGAMLAQDSRLSPSHRAHWLDRLHCRPVSPFSLRGLGHQQSGVALLSLLALRPFIPRDALLSGGPCGPSLFPVNSRCVDFAHDVGWDGRRSVPVPVLGVAGAVDAGGRRVVCPRSDCGVARSAIPPRRGQLVPPRCRARLNTAGLLDDASKYLSLKMSELRPVDNASGNARSTKGGWYFPRRGGQHESTGCAVGH